MSDTDSLTARLDRIISDACARHIHSEWGTSVVTPEALVTILVAVTLAREDRDAGDTFPRAPRDEVEREACENVGRGRWCAARPGNSELTEGQTYCSRKPHADGDHVAASGVGGPSQPVVLARWSSAPAASPPETPTRDERPMLSEWREDARGWARWRADVAAGPVWTRAVAQGWEWCVAHLGCAVAHDIALTPGAARDAADAAAVKWYRLPAVPASPPQPVHEGGMATHKYGGSPTCCEDGHDWIAWRGDGRGWALRFAPTVPPRLVACPFCGARLDAAPAPKPDPITIAAPGGLITIAGPPDLVDGLRGDPRPFSRLLALGYVYKAATGGYTSELERAAAVDLRARRASPAPATGKVDVLAFLDRLCSTHPHDRPDSDARRARAAVEQLTRERDELRRGYLDIADAVARESNGPADLAAQARATRDERDRLRAELEQACAKVVEIDEENGALKEKLKQVRADLATWKEEAKRAGRAHGQAMDMHRDCDDGNGAEIERLRDDLARATGERAEVERLAAEDAAAMRAACADLARRDAVEKAAVDLAVAYAIYCKSKPGDEQHHIAIREFYGAGNALNEALAPASIEPITHAPGGAPGEGAAPIMGEGAKS